MRIAVKTALGAFMSLGLGLSAVSMAHAASPQREYPIGTITYEARPERETLNLRRGEGNFRGIRFDVRQGDVDVLDLRVAYDDGSAEVIRVNQFFRAGSASRVFEIDSRRREVRSVSVSYLPKGPVRLTLLAVGGGGGGGGDGGGGGEWARLGCKDVKFLVDRDTLKVGRQEGRFAALRLKVRRSPVEMFSLRVTFGNGSRMEVPVREFIPAGGGTRPIELPGGNRGIDRVEMMYRSVPTLAGSAEVCIDGLER